MTSYAEMHFESDDWRLDIGREGSDIYLRVTSLETHETVAKIKFYGAEELTSLADKIKAVAELL